MKKPTRIEQQFTEHATGPFTNRDEPNKAYILNSLSELGFSESILSKADTNKLHENTLILGNINVCFNVFPKVPKPLFYHSEEAPSHLRMGEDGVAYWDFYLCKYNHGTCALVIKGKEATPEVHDTLIRSISNLSQDEAYPLHKECAAFFQGGYSKPYGEYFYIEFIRGYNAKPYIEWLNKNMPVPV